MAAKRKWINRFSFDINTNILQIELEREGIVYQVYTTESPFPHRITSHFWFAVFLTIFILFFICMHIIQ